jgi:hypothetical protein
MPITYGLDLSSATSYAYTTDYGGYFITPLYTVGSVNSLRKFQEIEFQLARPMRTGEGIRIAYRNDLTASFTTLGTYDYSTWSAIVSHNAMIMTTPAQIPACEQIQFKISLLGSSTTSPELKTIILR